MTPGTAFTLGCITVLVIDAVIAMFFYLNKKNNDVVPPRPDPKLTEDIKEKIREEIKSDSDAELVARILRKLDRGKRVRK